MFTGDLTRCSRLDPIQVVYGQPAVEDQLDHPVEPYFVAVEPLRCDPGLELTIDDAEEGRSEDGAVVIQAVQRVGATGIEPVTSAV
jgi:hypothetical protein